MRKNQYVLTVTKESNCFSYGCEIQAFTKKEFTAKAPAEVWAMMNNTTYEEQFYSIECIDGMSEQDQVDEFIMSYVDELGLDHGNCFKILYYGNFSDEIYYEEEDEEEIEMTTADAEAEADTKEESDEQEGEEPMKNDEIKVTTKTINVEDADPRDPRAQIAIMFGEKTIEICVFDDDVTVDVKQDEKVEEPVKEESVDDVDPKTAERIRKIREFSGEQLVQGYKWCLQNFNPFDDDFCAKFKLLEEELTRRAGGK